MTPQEVIKALELAKAEVEWEYTLEYAIAIDEAIKAVEKQIPKKAKVDDKYNVFVCPTCQRVIAWMNEKVCLNCGQKLDWGDKK